MNKQNYLIFIIILLFLNNIRAEYCPIHLGSGNNYLNGLVEDDFTDIAVNPADIVRIKGLKYFLGISNLLDLDELRIASVSERTTSIIAGLMGNLDPDEFLKSHTNLGGAAPEENERLLKERRKTLDAAVKRHDERKEKVTAAIDSLRKMSEDIRNGAC